MENGGHGTPVSIHCIPDELLVEIFKSGPSRPKAGSSELPFPILISTVCSHWNDIAVNLPVIWSEIDIFLRHARPIQVAQMWLRRSRSNPLDITLDIPPSSQTLEEDLRRVVELLLKHSKRWRRLVIVESHSWGSTIDVVISLLLNVQSAPQLQEFHLRSLNAVRPFSGLLGGYIFSEGAPMLHSVRLQGVRVGPPLAGLTTLDLFGLRTTYDVFRGIVDASPSLSVLILQRLYRTSTPDTEDLPSIEIPSLRSLAISFAVSLHSEECVPLFSFLSMPNLEYLELNGDYMPRLETYFRSTFSRLHTLRLCRLSTRFSEISVQFLRSLPMLSHLQLIQPNGDFFSAMRRIRSPSLLRSRSINLRRDFKHHESCNPPPEPNSGSSMLLASVFGKSILWPELRVITLDTIQPTSDVQWLLQTVSARLTANRPLSVVRLSHPAVYYLSDEKKYEGRDALSWLRDRVVIEKILSRESGYIDTRD